MRKRAVRRDAVGAIAVANRRRPARCLHTAAWADTGTRSRPTRASDVPAWRGPEVRGWNDEKAEHKSPTADAASAVRERPLDLDVREPVQPAREIPAALVEKAEHGRQ